MINKQINISNIRENIDKNGFHCSENFFEQSEIDHLRKFVDSQLKENNNQYFFLTSESTTDNILNDKYFFKSIENLLQKIVINYNFNLRENEKLYKVLRVVTGKKSKKVSLDFHFDAHLLTLLIPIYIPNRKNSDNGNLIIIKNLRKITSNLFKNIIQKFFFSE